MKKDKRFWVSIVYLVLGIALVSSSFAGIVDEFWYGMGCGLLGVATAQFIRFYRLNKNEKYRERMEIEASDERIHYIRNKAWAWAGYLFVIITGVGVIIFKIVGLDFWSQAAAFAVCFIITLYWISFFCLRKKY